MSQPVIFADVLDAADQLDTDSQTELIAILSRRLAERGRERVIASVEEAERQYASGGCRAVTVEELIREATS